MTAIRNVKTASGVVHITCKGQGRITKTGPKMWNVLCRPLKGVYAEGTTDSARCTKCLNAAPAKRPGGSLDMQPAKAPKKALKPAAQVKLDRINAELASQPTMPATMTDWNAMLGSAPKGFDVQSAKSAGQIKKLIHKPEYDGSFPVAEFQGVAYRWIAYLSNDDKSFVVVLQADGPYQPNQRYTVRTWTHNNDASVMFRAWMHMCATLALDTGSSVYSEMQ